MTIPRSNPECFSWEVNGRRCYGNVAALVDLRGAFGTKYKDEKMCFKHLRSYQAPTSCVKVGNVRYL